ncbi:UNVERIFIED_CONTAM: hypothetical protein K2H54_024150 [Gekko kuhli]
MWIGWAVLIGLLEVDCCNAEIIQKPSLVLQENQTALLECLPEKGHNAKYWYRQDAGQGLELLFYFYYEAQQDTGKSLDRFTAEQPHKDLLKMSISQAKPEDSGVAAEMWIGWAVLLGLLEIGHCSAEITQQPSLVLQENQTALLECHQKKGHDAMYWYRQDAGQGLQLLFYFYFQKQQDAGKSPDRFRADQPQKDLLKMNILLVKPEDSAIGISCSLDNLLFWGESVLALANPCLMVRAVTGNQADSGTGRCHCDAEITQQPSLVLQENQNALLVCHQKKGHNAMYWYRQDAGQGLEFLFYFYFQKQEDKGKNLDRFRADQPQKDRFNLNISLVKPEDSAVYFCASSQDTAIQKHHLFLQKPPPFISVCVRAHVYGNRNCQETELSPPHRFP